MHVYQAFNLSMRDILRLVPIMHHLFNRISNVHIKKKNEIFVMLKLVYLSLY